MKKAVALIVKMAGGDVRAIGGESVAPLLAAAREIRETGIVDGARAVGGMVLASHRPYPVMRFRVDKAASDSNESDDAPKKRGRKSKES